MSIGLMLERSAKKFPSKPALIFDKERLSYQALDEKTNSVACKLISLGIKKGDRVALLMANSIEFVISYFGIVKTGAIVLPVNILLKSDEIKFILNDAGASLLITSEEFMPVITPIRPEVTTLKNIVLKGKSPADGCVMWEEMFKNSGKSLPEVELNTIEDVASIIYTSGTTGKPKGAMLTHNNLLSDVESAVEMLGCGDEEIFLCVLPLFHAFAATVCMIAPLYLGASVVIMVRFNPIEVLKKIEEEKATLFAGVPSMYAVWAGIELPRIDLSSWKLCISGGAALPVEVMKAFEAKYKIPICEGDGPTECSPVTSCNPPKGLRKPGSIGLPLPRVYMKIVDDMGNELPIGEVGEIIVKGPNVMKGYWNNPQATRESIKDGWFYTGDMGKKDRDGYFYIVDRKKDMVIVGGMNVYPRELEEVLYSHPKVLEAAVIGIEDKLRGEVPVAVVVLKDNQHATEKELIEYCKERLANYKVPKRVEFVTGLPKTATGKILKRELKKTFL